MVGEESNREETTMQERLEGGRRAEERARAVPSPLPLRFATPHKTLNLMTASSSSALSYALHQAVAKDLNSSSNLSVSCVHTFQTHPFPNQSEGKGCGRYERGVAEKSGKKAVSSTLPEGLSFANSLYKAHEAQPSHFL